MLLFHAQMKNFGSKYQKLVEISRLAILKELILFLELNHENTRNSLNFLRYGTHLLDFYLCEQETILPTKARGPISNIAFF